MSPLQARQRLERVRTHPWAFMRASHVLRAGVVFTKWTLGLSGASDTVIRHLRVRPGTASGATIDGMGMRGSNFGIMDRCSISWTIDESFVSSSDRGSQGCMSELNLQSSRDAWNITFQRSLISEPLQVDNCLM